MPPETVNNQGVAGTGVTPAAQPTGTPTGNPPADTPATKAGNVFGVHNVHNSVVDLGGGDEDNKQGKPAEKATGTPGKDGETPPNPEDGKKGGKKPDGKSPDAPTDGKKPDGSQPEDGDKLTDDLMKRFKDAKSLGKAYRELEKTYTQTNQETASLRKQVAELEKSLEELRTAPKENGRQAPGMEKIDKEEFARRLMDDPQATITSVFKDMLSEVQRSSREAAQKAEAAAREQADAHNAAVVAFREAHPDFEELKDSMLQVINEEFPDDISWAPERILQAAYDIVRGRNAPELVKKAREEAQAETEKKLKGSFVESGSGTSNRTADKAKKPEDAIAEQIVSVGSKNSPFL